MGVVFWFCSYGCFIRISQHFKIIQVQLTPSWFVCLSSVQFSRSVMSDSFRPHGLQHARPPCPLPTPGAYSNPCPLSRWCCPTVSSSVIPFSFRLQSFPASGSFPMSQFFAWGGQSIRVSVSASASVLPMTIQTDFIYNMKFSFIITILNVLIIFTYFSSSWINNYFDSKCHRTIKLIEQKFFNA